MGGPTAHAHVQAYGAFATAHHAQAGGFANHGVIPRRLILDQFQDTAIFGFLIHHATDRDAAAPVVTRAERQQGGQHAGERAFHVRGASAPETAIADVPAEGIDAHADDTHVIGVAVKQQMRAVAVLMGERNVVAAGQHGVAPRLKLLRVAPVFQPIDHLGFAGAGRIVHGVDTRPAHEFLGNFKRGHLSERR